MTFWSEARNEMTKHLPGAVVIDISPVKNKLSN